MSDPTKAQAMSREGWGIRMLAMARHYADYRDYIPGRLKLEARQKYIDQRDHVVHDILVMQAEITGAHEEIARLMTQAAGYAIEREALQSEVERLRATPPGTEIVPEGTMDLLIALEWSGYDAIRDRYRCPRCEGPEYPGIHDKACKLSGITTTHKDTKMTQEAKSATLVLLAIATLLVIAQIR